MVQEKKITRNTRERIIAFVYVFLLFSVVTVISCWALFYYAGSRNETRKEFVIAKMERIRSFQNDQNRQMAIVDSIYSRIAAFDPGLNASFEESDIKLYLNEIAGIYNNNRFDERYKIFAQVSSFYNMWFADKKELWSKQQNIIRFQRDLEECRIGLERRQDELRNNNR
jgi:hypothetical protein